MTYIRRFFIDKQHLGDSEAPLEYVQGEWQQPAPYVMFCPKCADIWARLPVEGSSRDHIIIGGYCEQHQSWNKQLIPGSLIIPWMPELTKILPDAVICREFDLHLRVWEKEQKEHATYRELEIL